MNAVMPIKWILEQIRENIDPRPKTITFTDATFWRHEKLPAYKSCWTRDYFPLNYFYILGFLFFSQDLVQSGLPNCEWGRRRQRSASFIHSVIEFFDLWKVAWVAGVWQVVTQESKLFRANMHFWNIVSALSWCKGNERFSNKPAVVCNKFFAFAANLLLSLCFHIFWNPRWWELV